MTILLFCVRHKTVTATDSINVETNKTSSNNTQMLSALQLLNSKNNTKNNTNNITTTTNNNNSNSTNNNGVPLSATDSLIQSKHELSFIQPKSTKPGGDLNNNNNNKNKDNNIFYTHNDNTPKRCAYENVVMNHTFALNKRAGVFTHLGHTRDIHQCKQMCCQVCKLYQARV